MENNKTENIYVEESYNSDVNHNVVQIDDLTSPPIGEKVKSNKTGNVLTTLGLFIIVFGIIFGIIFGYKDDEFRWIFAVICWATGILSGMLFMGLGEIILLLQKLVDKD